MKLVVTALAGWLLLAAPSAAQAQQPQPRVLELKTSDGTLLKATYFAAAQPGPGVLLLYRSQGPRLWLPRMPAASRYSLVPGTSSNCSRVRQKSVSFP
jgi:hypothetical protein